MTLLTPMQAAAKLALSRTMVLRLARAGVLPCVRVNARVVRFSDAALDRWIARREK